ncbi:MAG: hypothetical protein DYG89_14005 [Caldilinea sp. CFX5]|nr:hypothetical protein [Caldilinea sp. CFX5]
MTNKWPMPTVGLLLLKGVGTVMILVLHLSGVAQPITGLATEAAMAQIVPAQNGAQVTGRYSGVVKLQFTVAGVYSDTLPTRIFTSTPDLGSIGLALSISQTGQALSGYGSLDKMVTLSAEQTIETTVNGRANLQGGPSINGNFDGINLTLLSERVAATYRGQPIQRQFRLTGAIGRSDGSQLGGQYRETIWGLADQPITVIGVFRLQRPIAGATVTSSKPPFGTATTAEQVMTYTPNVCAVATALIRDNADSSKDETAMCISDATPALCHYPWPRPGRDHHAAEPLCHFSRGGGHYSVGR